MSDKLMPHSHISGTNPAVALVSIECSGRVVVLYRFAHCRLHLHASIKMSDDQLKTVFSSFCAFGAGSKDAKPLMDNAKFGKLFRDLKIYDKKFTSTDTDIIFNRPEVKPKTERKINFEQFKVALALCAEKKYGSKDKVDQMIEKVCAGKGPGTSGATKAVKAGGVDRLTDTSKYTGSHKERFDESGKGKGLEGRKDYDAKAAEGYVGGYKGKDTYDKTH